MNIMRTIRTIEGLTWSLINITTFVVLLAVFILVFFYPETFGAILGKITKSFKEALQ